MTAIDSPRPLGTPNFIDFTCNDVTAASEFLDKVLGSTTPPGAPEFGGYTMAQIDGRPVCGVAPAMAADGTPQRIDHDYLTVYLATDDIEATLAKVTQAGGSQELGPMDIPGMGPDAPLTGRMAIATDPQGNSFGLWQGIGMPGFAAVNEPGFPSWFELATSDPQAAAEFYASVFGLTFGPMSVDGRDYQLCEQFGIMSGDHGWNAFLTVADLEAAMRTALENGAREVTAAHSFEYGTFSEISTPGGARLGLFQG